MPAALALRYYDNEFLKRSGKRICVCGRTGWTLFFLVELLNCDCFALIKSRTAGEVKPRRRAMQLSFRHRLLCPLSPPFPTCFFLLHHCDRTSRKPSFLHFSPCSSAAAMLLTYFHWDFIYLFIYHYLSRKSNILWLCTPEKVVFVSDTLFYAKPSSFSPASAPLALPPPVFGWFLCVCARTEPTDTDDACTPLGWKWFELFSGSVWRSNGPPPSAAQPITESQFYFLRKWFLICADADRWPGGDSDIDGNDTDGHCPVHMTAPRKCWWAGNICRLKAGEDDRRRRASARDFVSCHRSRSRRMVAGGISMRSPSNRTISRTETCLYSTTQHNHSHTVIVNCNCLTSGHLLSSHLSPGPVLQPLFASALVHIKTVCHNRSHFLHRYVICVRPFFSSLASLCFSAAPWTGADAGCHGHCHRPIGTVGKGVVEWHFHALHFKLMNFSNDFTIGFHFFLLRWTSDRQRTRYWDVFPASMEASYHGRCLEITI